MFEHIILSYLIFGSPSDNRAAFSQAANESCAQSNAFERWSFREAANWICTEYWRALGMLVIYTTLSF